MKAACRSLAYATLLAFFVVVPNAHAKAVGTWKITFEDGPTDPFGDSLMPCRLAQITLEIDATAAKIAIGTTTTSAMIKLLAEDRIEISYDIEDGEPNIMIGKFGLHSGSGKWRAGTLSCAGTWTATRQD